MLEIEIEKLGVDRTIQGRVKRQMEKAQKEYYLNEKIQGHPEGTRPRREEQRSMS